MTSQANDVLGQTDNSFRWCNQRCRRAKLYPAKRQEYFRKYFQGTPMAMSGVSLRTCSTCLAILALHVGSAAHGQLPSGTEHTPLGLEQSPVLKQLVDDAARKVIDERRQKGMKESEIAITLIDLDGEAPFASASFNGDVAIYPASVVKLFYLVAAHQQMEDGELQDTSELRRALRDMIVHSSNDATHYVVDALTGTSSGVELPEAEMKDWAEKRNRMNRYFASLGYENINVNQKTYCEDVYGRDRVFRGAKAENRNRLTTDATARLLAEIATRTVVDAARCGEMLELLKRDPYAESSDPDDQARGFTGRAMNGATGPELAEVRLWSKAGWTSTTRHDAAYIELPGGHRFVLVTFTVSRAKDKDIIPTIAHAVIDHFARKGPADETQ